MKEAYRLIGLLLALTCISAAAMDYAGVMLGDGSVGFNSFDIYLLVYAAVLLALSLIPRHKVYIQLISRTYTIPVKRICSLFQFVGLVTIATMLMLFRQDAPYVMTVVLITGLMGIKYHIMHYRGVLLLGLYYLLLVGSLGILNGASAYSLKLFVNTIYFYVILALLFQDELKVQFRLIKRYRQQTAEIRSRLRRYESQQLDPGVFGLTHREMEVLELLCMTNASNQQLADELGIKIFTIKTHLRNIFDKAGVDDRHQLIDLCRNYFLTSEDQSPSHGPALQQAARRLR